MKIFSYILVGALILLLLFFTIYNLVKLIQQIKSYVAKKNADKKLDKKED